jgi:hypothetical protein
MQLAIGALHKSRLSSPFTRRSKAENEPVRDLHREFALLQYNKALNAIRDTVSESENVKNPRKVIPACLLVVCLENFHGNKS